MTKRRRAARGLLLGVAVGAVLSTGCGKKGPPLPPLRSYPRPVERLTSRQVGDRVILSFPEPTSRTDGSPLGPDAKLEVMMTTRDPVPKRVGEIEQNPEITWAVPRSDWDAYAQGKRLDVGIGLARITAGLGQSAAAPALKGRRLSFIVQVVESGNKRSVPSGIETLEVCAPPPAPVDAAVRVVEEGLRVTWSPGSTGAPADPNASARFNVYREEEGGERPAAPFAQPPAGAVQHLDDTAVLGRTYRYVVRAATAAARCESADSPVAAAARVDLFPPAPPQGLAAVAEGGAIRLFWRPNRESDLNGYRVYRAAGEGAPWTVLTPQDQTATSYTDEDVKPGVVYSYAVTARDGATPPNESEFSDPAIEKTEKGK